MDVGHEGGQRNSEIRFEVQLLEYAISPLKEALDEKKSRLKWAEVEQMPCSPKNATKHCLWVIFFFTDFG